MRLAVFTNQFPAAVSTFFARDMRSLVEAGLDVDIFAIYPEDATLWRYVPEILNERVLPRQRVHHLSLPGCVRRMTPWPPAKVPGFLRDTLAVGASASRYGIVPLSKSAYVLLKAWAWSRQHANQYDHVLGYWGNYSGTCAYLFSRLQEKSHRFSLFLHANVDLYRDRVYLRQKLLHADNVITCCEFNRRYIEEHYPDIGPEISKKIHVHHHGLDFGELPYEPDDRPPFRVIAVGRMVEQKGFEYLLHAARELVRRGMDDLEIEFVGDGPKAGSLRALARELEIDDRVRFRGFLTFEETRDAMGQATMLVHPSPGLGDGLPNVIKEAMALGTPVVASSVAGITEGLDRGRCGVLVPPQDVKALANGMETLYYSRALRRQYADAARGFAQEKFDLWENGKDLARLLRHA